MTLRPLALGALALSLTAGIAVPAAAAPVENTADETTLIGHRGAAGVAPENTLSAIKAGSQSGADYIEIDVQLSKDGVPFVFHDDTPSRTTNAKDLFPGRENDPITSFTWDELQQLDAGSYFSAAFAGEKIPHFNSVPGVLTGTTGVYIEIKSPAKSPGVEQLVADALAEGEGWSRLLDQDRIEVLGFDAASNRTFAQLAPGVPLQQLAGSVPDAATLENYAQFADSFGTSYRTLDAAGSQRVKDAGLQLGVYTVNSTEAAEQSLDLGVERITGDFPQQVARHLSGRKPFPSNDGLVIAESVNDVPGNDLQPQTGEHVVLENTGHRTLSLEGYLVRDAANNVMRIPAGYQVEPGQQLRLYPGPGTNSSQAVYLGGGVAVLNNGGDSLALWNSKERLMDTYAN
ncbi:glycerophosphodiester phosphodiesterase family protein [Glutamicibacter protophormiae]|uniref:glycerophosphodiester phosphodiesterase family protein n=1 Tax=Glutamicibacter protophormiae TaxID=37930 RepID=UPI002A804820|nr:glycerophosphodiester phosphodiesterase family protein [Glutamicibacter protophormiae]WPR65151.1 glycerophosphodiester phosphodiesterase family protein [Glutamicibacter protophormiae]WPR68648.1 glycerophosphodiester phosphodiesterase family protein [Glutamicibacter protophormiae]